MEFNFSLPIKGIKDFTIEADSLEEARKNVNLQHMFNEESKAWELVDIVE